MNCVKKCVMTHLCAAHLCVMTHFLTHFYNKDIYFVPKAATSGKGDKMNRTTLKYWFISIRFLKNIHDEDVVRIE